MGFCSVKWCENDSRTKNLKKGGITYHSDAALGRCVLTAVGALFLLFLLWVNTYPFIDDELAIHAWLPDPQWALLFCAIWGLFFVGGLMAYTLYHLRPHL